MITMWETGYHRSRDTNSICVERWVQAVSCALVLNISPITYSTVTLGYILNAWIILAELDPPFRA